MADTYGVVPADVAREIPALFRLGFTQATQPTADQVTGFITTADTVVGLHVRDVTDVAPAASDKAAVLAVRYIISWVTARVLQVVYAGNDPEKVKTATAPYDESANNILISLEKLGAQAVGDGTTAAPRILTGCIPTREMVISDEQLDAGHCRERLF